MINSKLGNYFSYGLQNVQTIVKNLDLWGKCLGLIYSINSPLLTLLDLYNCWVI